jgi:hypothetical protein
MTNQKIYNNQRDYNIMVQKYSSSEIKEIIEGLWDRGEYLPKSVLICYTEFKSKPYFLVINENNNYTLPSFSINQERTLEETVSNQLESLNFDPQKDLDFINYFFHHTVKHFGVSEETELKGTAYLFSLCKFKETDLNNYKKGLEWHTYEDTLNLFNFKKDDIEKIALETAYGLIKNNSFK